MYGYRLVNKLSHLAFVFTFALLTFVRAEITWSGDIALVMKGLDRHITENANFRGDDPFNDVRLRLMPRHWINSRMAVFGEILLDNGANDTARLNGAYVVINQLVGRDWLSLKAGMIPSPFGNYGLRSTYFNLNPLVGVPLMWHYKTPMPNNMFPTAALLLKDKTNSGPGYAPIGYDACWDRGIELFGHKGIVEYSFALTEGTLSSPKAASNNGRQVIVKLSLRPIVSLNVGGSLAYGPYLQDIASDTAYRKIENYKSTVAGVHFEYIVNHIQIFSELVQSKWETAEVALKDGSATANSGYVEGRYDILPQWYIAGRFDFLTYGNIENPDTGSMESWGDNMWRIESGIGYRLSREAIVKLVHQFYNYELQAPADTPQVTALQLQIAF